MKKTSSVNIWSKNTPLAKDVGAFIKIAPKESQAKLVELRRVIRATAPKAEEIISYRMPAYRLNGKILAGFAGYKKHVGFYPMSGSFLDDYKKELMGYKTSKGAIQFPLDKPLPVGLIKKLIKARVKTV